MTAENDESIVKAKAREKRAAKSITASSTAEYFAKNLQQVGFSSPTKAVLTTLKEALDNSLDACEENSILPDITVEVEKLGAGTLKNTDLIRVRVQDNGPGIDAADVPKVFGEYLASSKFGRGRCSRGQQGIGISAATTWALQTSASGAKVITKQAKQRKALSCVVEIDLKNNKGIVKNKEMIDWEPAHGTSVEFNFEGRIQLNGEAGLNNYLKANVFVNPHMRLTYRLPDMNKEEVIDRVSKECPEIPEAVDPHPHTMKLGEFMAHAALFGKVKTSAWLKKGFSRLSDNVISEIQKNSKLSKAILEKPLSTLKETEFKDLFTAIQAADLMAPSTKSVLSIGEQGLSKSIQRIGEVDFFSVVTRKPTICDFKPVQVEVAIARLKDKGVEKTMEEEDSVQVLRFANRVPLQFDKSACAIVKAITTVNWKAYGLRQAKSSVPLGPYIICVSVVSPFIKFKNASKETIDASDELVEELRRALIQAGQLLSRHIRRENKEFELEEKIRHIEKFGPILVETLARITKAPAARKEKAEQGLLKLLGRDAKETKLELKDAEVKLDEQKERHRARLGLDEDENEDGREEEAGEGTSEAEVEDKSAKKKGKREAKGKREKPVKTEKTEEVENEATAAEVKPKKSKKPKKKDKT